MNSVETPDNPISPTQTDDQAGTRRSSDDADAPHYFAVFYFQDGRRAELVIPGVTGMCGGGDVDGPGRISIYGPAADGERRTRRLLAARLFNDLAELAVVAEPLELDIAEASEAGG